jgi:hypothetical protein
LLEKRGEICFFADVCLLLPQTNRPEINVELTNEILHGGSCYISSSVKEKFVESLDNTYDYIVKDLRDNLPKYFESIHCAKVSDVDGLLFEVFFAERRRQLGKERKTSLHFIIEAHIESWIVNLIHSLKRGTKVQVQDLLSAIFRELSNKYEELKSPVETLDVIDIVPKGQLKANLLLQGIENEEDEEHIASAIEYQYTKNKWVIFLTYDERHILHCAHNLRENCTFYVSKPIYANDHRRNLSKEPAPVSYFKQIKNPTDKQKNFSKVLSDKLGITIYNAEPTILPS